MIPLSTPSHVSRQNNGGMATESPNIADGDEPPAKRRRLLLQTMGQQLREVGSSGQQKPVICSNGNRNGIEFMRSVNNGLNVDQNSAKHVQIQIPESDIVPGEDEQPNASSAGKYLWQPTEVVDSQTGPTFDDLISWTRNYFDNWHPAYPHINAPAMLEFFDIIAKTGFSEARKSLFQFTMLRTMVSMSIADNRQIGHEMSSVPASLVFLNFHDAMGSIANILCHETSLVSLQAIVSVQLFLVSMLRYNAASRLGGLAVRMGYQLGLQRCSISLLGYSHKDNELRQRVFWSIYCLDRQICPRLGLPLAIKDEDIDVCYPGHERHTEGGDGSQNRDSRLDLLVFIAQNASIRGSITELRNRSTLGATLLENTPLTINTKLTKWWNEVEEYLESSGSQEEALSNSHRVTLTALKHESMIALNRSILATSTESVAYNAALQNCIGASRSVINTLHAALQAGTPLLWPSFTWAAWMSAFILVYAANEDQMPREVAIRFVNRTLQILKHLSLRGSSWPDACTAAIRGLRSQLIEDRNRSRVSTANKADAQTVNGTLPQVNEDTSRARHDMTGNRATENAPIDGTSRVGQVIHTYNTNPRHLNAYDQSISNQQAAPQSSAFVDPNWPSAGNGLYGYHGTGWNMSRRGSQQHTIPLDQQPTIMDIFQGSDIPFWLGDDDQAVGFALNYEST